MALRCRKTVRTSFLVLLVGAKRAALTDLPHPYPFPYGILTLLHFTLPVLRILFLVILFFALINPIVTYTTVTSAEAVPEDQSTSAPLLRSSQEPVNSLRSLGLAIRATKYGTFDDAAYSATGQPPSPASADHVAAKIQVHPYIGFSHVSRSSSFRSRHPRERKSTSIQPGAKYSDAYAVSLPTFGQRRAVPCSSSLYVLASSCAEF